MAGRRATRLTPPSPPAFFFLYSWCVIFDNLMRRTLSSSHRERARMAAGDRSGIANREVQRLLAESPGNAQMQGEDEIKARALRFDARHLHFIQ